MCVCLCKVSVLNTLQNVCGQWLTSYFLKLITKSVEVIRMQSFLGNRVDEFSFQNNGIPNNLHLFMNSDIILHADTYI